MINPMQSLPSSRSRRTYAAGLVNPGGGAGVAKSTLPSLHSFHGPNIISVLSIAFIDTDRLL